MRGGAAASSCVLPLPESRGYRAGIRNRQRPRGRALYRCRPACKQQPRSHQHLGAGRAITHDARRSRLRRSGWPDVLGSKHRRRVSTRRRLCRQNSARGQAWRHSGRAADQVRSRSQSNDREGAGPHDSRIVPAARRRTDRVVDTLSKPGQAAHELLLLRVRNRAYATRVRKRPLWVGQLEADPRRTPRLPV